MAQHLVSADAAQRGVAAPIAVGILRGDGPVGGAQGAPLGLGLPQCLCLAPAGVPDRCQTSPGKATSLPPFPRLAPIEVPICLLPQRGPRGISAPWPPRSCLATCSQATVVRKTVGQRWLLALLCHLLSLVRSRMDDPLGVGWSPGLPGMHTEQGRKGTAQAETCR